MHLHKYMSEKIDMNVIYVLPLPPKLFHFPSINLHAVPYLHGDKQSFPQTLHIISIYQLACRPEKLHGDNNFFIHYFI